jgi:manganese oxidase
MDPVPVPDVNEVAKDPAARAAPRVQSPTRGRRRTAAIFVAIVVIVAALLVATYLSLPLPGPAPYEGQVRAYYIAADEVEWNYTPSGMNEITGAPFGAQGAGDILYTAHNSTYLGSTFLKCVYQQFPNGTFTTPEPRPSDERYLGILGPLIYAEVEDTVHVDFRNNCQFPESIHPQGLTYPSNSSGIPYNDSEATGNGGAVPTGGEFNYTWYVPSQAGPGPMDGSSILWAYQSGASLLNSSDTGLVGPIIVTARGMGDPNGSPSGVAQNIVIYENIFNEGNSPYLTYNIAHDALDPSAVNLSDPTWDQSLNKYAINGYIFGNMPMVQLVAGQDARWYVLAMGNDMHSVQWSGGPVMYDGESTDAVPLLPGATSVADMVPTTTGIWLVQSGDITDIAGGMQERYQVGATPVAATREPTPGSSVPALTPLQIGAPSWGTPSGGPP